MPKACFWGRPCNCIECQPELKDKCEICSMNEGFRVAETGGLDRKGIIDYDFKTYCVSCYQENIEQYKHKQKQSDGEVTQAKKRAE